MKKKIFFLWWRRSNYYRFNRWNYWKKIDNRPIVLKIPSEINGKKVLNIDEDSFSGLKIESLTLPDSLTEIGNSAFYNNQISNVDFPNSLKTIGKDAFAQNKLINLILPNSVNSIGDEAFADNDLRNVKLPDSLTVINYGLFIGNDIEKKLRYQSQFKPLKMMLLMVISLLNWYSQIL